MTGPQEPDAGQADDLDPRPVGPVAEDRSVTEGPVAVPGADDRTGPAAHEAAGAVSRDDERPAARTEEQPASRPAPVGGGVPPRPQPLPPPRPTGLPSGEPTQALPRPGSAASTVVPGRGQGRPAPPRPPLAAGRPVKGRKARLALRRLDPWSVFVMSLLLSLFLAVITIVAAFVLYGILSAIGVPHSINKGVTEVKGGSAVLTQGRFVGVAALIAAVNVVLLTALGTLGSLLYNVCASFTGGLEVTLAERD